MKKAGVLFLISVLLFTGCSNSLSSKNIALTGEIKLENNQSLLYGKITEINGNEITFDVLEAGTIENKERTDMPSDDEQTSDQRNISNRKGKDRNTKENKEDNTKENKEDNKKENKVIYKSTGEEQTRIIPVGTKVTTLLGVESTFSRIAVDDTIVMVIEQNDNDEDTIVSVYIVG
ncbi:hypothetical protein [Anaerosacchariphilus polymeriproducens]|uniref:Lipoprotein n=1 Tax=Anaerosacchariphilus polymeriproducens TaxID=1812858 RepID=A0A371AXU1_9FIRM|nr:hypothetical protein [Anaerosacchariphilus polymeriproducens]RDU24398.1 hypothetical protein DWV06_05340 [Anaerosacchariphilus polymeriproducens]